MDTQNELPTNAIKAHKIIFHAKAGEYFRIWIVNLALTILSLGIYSAWAKVRTKKYLFGNIEIAGSRFDYHADPIKILKGRILVGALFLGYSIGGKISPVVGLVFGLLFFVAMPWIVVRALIFNLTNTSYRNIRFGFLKDYKASYIAYGKSVLSWVLTLGFGFPLAMYIFDKFKIHGIRFGKTYLSFKGSIGDFFKIYYTAAIFMIFGFAVFGLAIAVFKKNPAAFVIGMICLYGGMLVASAWVRAEISNLTTNKSQLGPIRFQSNQDPMELAWLYFTNLVACMFTLGLAIPWAIIRVQKYRYEHTTLLMTANAFDQIQTEATVTGQVAAADAAADFWDIDLGF